MATVAIADRLFDRRVGLLAGAFYVFCPFTLFYDRLALADACLSALFALTLLLSLRIVAGERRRFGILAGVVMALGVYAKAPGVLLFAVPMATALFVGFRRDAGRALLAAYAVGVPPAAYALWRFATTRNTADMVGIATRSEQPLLARAASNLGEAAGWLWGFWTPTLAVLGLAGLAIALLRRRREGLLLAALAAFPVLAFGLTLSRWLPRYLLFGSVPFLVLGAWALCVLVDRATTARPGAFRSAALAVAAAAVLVPSLRFDLALWTDPPRAPLPAL